MTTRRDIEELMPAYVNGTTTPDEQAAVARALAEDPALADEQRFVAALGERLRSQAGASPGELGWHRLRRSIERETRAPQRTTWARVAGVAAALVIAVQAGLLWQGRDARDGYGPLGGGSGADIQIRFEPGTTAADIEALLSESNLEIVSGPSAAGLYRVDVLDGQADVDALVERLAERDAIVEFVAPE